MEDETVVTTLAPEVPEIITTTESEDLETTTTELEDFTTAHPHTIPLPWAFSELLPFTEHVVKNVTVVSTILEGQNVKRWSQNSGMAGAPFSVILAKPHLPPTEEKLPLVVLLHDGPHEQSTQEFSLTANTLLEMGMAVLLVNYRGSTGLGDASLQSIISNILLVTKNTHLFNFSPENMKNMKLSIVRHK